MKQVLPYILLFTGSFHLLQCTTFAQKKEPAVQVTESRKVNVNYMLRGYFYAASSIPDTLAPGGFGGSGNQAKSIDNETKFSDKKRIPILFIDTTVNTDFSQGYEGYKFFLINQTSQTLRFKASDSRLSMIAEAFFQGMWQPIEYLPSSWCGNSYHHLYLKDKEYWEFNIPRYYGKRKVKLRYKLETDDNKIYYSNEIWASVNPKQFIVKQGHTPSGIMDPYSE